MQIDALMANASLAQQSAQSLSDPKQNGRGYTKDEAYQVASDFEAQVLTIMNQSMFTGVETDGYFGGGHGEEMFRSMLVDEYSGEMTQAGGIGITDVVYREILAMQEKAS